MDKNTKDLTVVNKSKNIIEKLRDLILGLFSKKKDNEQYHKNIDVTPKEEKDEKEETKKIDNANKENSFIESVKIEDSKVDKRLVKLQNLISEEIITEDELPEADRIALHELYDMQILELKRQIDEYKEKILKLRANISE